jgi:hypothetical protein
MNARLKTGKENKENKAGKTQILYFKKKDLKDSKQAGHPMLDRALALSIIFRHLKS